jgi:hypothetical protein
MRNKILISLIVFALSSCSTFRYIYSASPANNPYFTRKGETKLTGYYSSGGNNTRLEKADGFDLQAAYAIGDHWAVTTGYFNRRELDIYPYSRYNSPFDSSKINYKRNLFDIGGGYFVALNQKKTITFNLYGGIASGKFSFEDNGTNNGANYNRFHNSNITKWFFQPSVNFMPGKYFRFAVILKTSFVHYGNIQTSYTREEQKYFSLDRIANQTLTFGEPEYNIQFGLPKYPWVKLDAAVSGASHHFSTDSQLDIRGNNTSIGLTFDFSKIKR